MIVISGSDIRRYRRAIGWNQRRFSDRLGLSQSALSLLEGDKITASQEYIERLQAAFDSGVGQTFSAFLEQLEADSAATLAALHAPGNRFTTLTVWRWEEGTDLSRRLLPTLADGVITIPAKDRPAIAFRMPQESTHWVADEVLVFETCGIDELRNRDLCLVHGKIGRESKSRTAVALISVARAKRGRSIRIEPISPPLAIFELGGQQLLGLLRVTCRVRSME